MVVAAVAVLMLRRLGRGGDAPAREFAGVGDGRERRSRVKLSGPKTGRVRIYVLTPTKIRRRTSPRRAVKLKRGKVR